MGLQVIQLGVLKKGGKTPIRNFIMNHQVVLGSGTANDSKMGDIAIGAGSTIHMTGSAGSIGL